MQSYELERIIDSYGNSIYSFCNKLTNNKTDADDLYQQTFLKALEICEKIDENKNVKAFLISLSVNIWKNHNRKLKRRQYIIPIENVDVSELVYSIKDIANNVENIVILNQEKQVLHKIITSLNDKHRIPLLMYYNAQLSIEEIAKSLKIPKGTVKSRLHKAKQLIREELEVYKYER